jgi:formyl-CoA transferase
MVVELGDYRGVGAPVKLSRTPASIRRPPPGFAEHTDEVMQENGLDAGAFPDAIVRER